MSEVKKCPKCGGEMEQGKDLAVFSFSIFFRKPKDWFGTEVYPFYCKDCGYIELYKEMKDVRERTREKEIERARAIHRQKREKKEGTDS